MKDPFLFLSTEEADFCDVYDLLSSFISFLFYAFGCGLALILKTS